jgi:hypothetical protein
MPYTCKKCGYETNHRGTFTRHINKKFDCSKSLIIKDCYTDAKKDTQLDTKLDTKNADTKKGDTEDDFDTDDTDDDTDDDTNDDTDDKYKKLLCLLEKMQNENNHLQDKLKSFESVGVWRDKEPVKKSDSVSVPVSVPTATLVPVSVHVPIPMNAPINPYLQFFTNSNTKSSTNKKPYRRI